MTSEQEIKRFAIESALKLPCQDVFNAEDAADDVIRAASKFEEYLTGTYKFKRRQDLTAENE